MARANLFYRLAGVDANTIATCPYYDRIWARHIGFALLLTFVVVFSISYLSIEYINGAVVALNPDTHALELVTDKRTPLSVSVTVLAASVIAAIVTLFDRALFQSDWFSQLPFRGQLGASKKVQYFLEKVFKSVVRIGMSLALAFALSTFVELKILESSILTVMQKHHLAENAGLYDELRKSVTSLDATQNGQKEIVAQLEVNLQKLISERSLDSKDLKVTLEAKIVTLKQELAQTDEVINKRPNDALAALQSQIVGVRTALVEGADKVRRFNKLANAEEAGNPEKLEGVSGIRTCKSRCKYFKKEAALEETLQVSRLDELKRLEGLALAENEKSLGAKQTHNQPFFDQIQSLQRQLEELPDQRNPTYFEALDKQIAVANSELNSRKDDIETDLSMLNLRADALFDQTLKNPAFIPFRDGPLDRLTALEEIKADPRNATSAIQFSMWLKIFIIFLEVVPVISKLFFSPPSVYAIKLQAQAFKQSDEAFADMKTEGLDGEIMLERKKIQLAEIINHRLMAEQANRDLKNAFDQVSNTNRPIPNAA